MVSKLTHSKEKVRVFIDDVFPIEKDEYYHSVYGKTTLSCDVLSLLSIKGVVKAPSKLKGIIRGLNAQKEVVRALKTKRVEDLPLQMHHFATNKHGIYTPQMELIAKKFGLSLEGTWNKELIHHLGRHPDKYHDFVLLNMEKAAREAKGDSK